MMYSEWTSLQTSIQSDSSHVSVLKRFPAAVGKEIVVPVVKNIAQGLSFNGNEQPSKLHTADEVNWTMEVVCHGLTLPFTEHDIIKECVNIYCEWLSGCLIRKRMCVPKPIIESPVSYSTTILSHLYNLFVPREKSTLDQVSRQALLCHRALRILETVAKESPCLNRELWEAMLKFLLAATDTLLAPPKEKDGISDELAERMVSVLFEMWLLSCIKYFPVPSLWRTFRDMCSNWRHHEPVIAQWNRVNYALTAPLLVKLYGPDHPELVIGANEKALVAAISRDSVIKLSDDCLLQCWFRFLHMLGNPVDLCKVDVISETPMFLHHAIASSKVVEPRQHECLHQLPVIFYKAMKGIANLMDSLLGACQPQRDEDVHVIAFASKASSSAPPSTSHTPPTSRHPSRASSVVSSSGVKPMSPNKLSSHSLNPAATPVSTPAVVTGGQLQYSSRPPLSPDRSSINSILNLIGCWLFEAAMLYENRRSRPSSQSQRAGSISSSSESTPSREFNFDSGRAEACGAIARLLCSKKTGEVIQPVYIARSYMAMYQALSLQYPVKGDVLTFTLFHMADILRVDLPGVNILIPKIMAALEAVLAAGQHNFSIHDQLTEVELRKACIHLLMSVICLPLHYHKMEIKDLYSGELMMSYISLTSRIAKLILNALMVEKSSSNSNMLLGCLALLVQDMATHENREMDKFSSATSNISHDQYNLSGGASETTSQSGDGQMEPTNDSTVPEVVLRRPSTRPNRDDFSSAAGLLVVSVRQICDGLISGWWTDYQLAVGGLEVLTSLARVKLQIISTAVCKETVSNISKLITFLCCRPPQNQTRDLHSMILAAFHCLSQWILEHSYLLQDKECLYTVLEVVELGISGKRSHQLNEVLLKGDKEHLPMSLRVKDAAEALLMCITDQVDSFPAPCGSESLYSTLSEKDLTDDLLNFKYFALNNLTILAVLDKEISGSSEHGPPPTKLVIRGPFGRQIWLIEPKSRPSGSVKPSHVPRPAPAAVSVGKAKVSQRWWPVSVDSVPLVKADKSLPGLDDLEDLDPTLATIINETIEKEVKNGPSLAQPKPTPPEECQPPKSSGKMQTARALLAQLGLLGSASLQDQQGMPPYLCKLDTGNPEFFNALTALDNIPNRTRDSVYIFYVKAGQTKVADILENTLTYRGLNGDFKDLLLSLGWPVNVNVHPGWTGIARSQQEPIHSHHGHEPAVDQIPLACGPAAYDGTKWLLYWADSRTEMAFIVPTDQRLAMINRKKQEKMISRKVSMRRKLSEDSTERRRIGLAVPRRRRGSLDVTTERIILQHQEKLAALQKATLDLTISEHEPECEEVMDGEMVHGHVSSDFSTTCPPDPNVSPAAFDANLTADAESITSQSSETTHDTKLPEGEVVSHSTVYDGVSGCYENNTLLRIRTKPSMKRSKLQRPKSYVTTSASSSPAAERNRRTTYDMVMGVISPGAHNALITEHEKRAKTVKEKRKKVKLESNETSTTERTRNDSTDTESNVSDLPKKSKGLKRIIKFHQRRRRSVSDIFAPAAVLKQGSTHSDSSVVFTSGSVTRESFDSGKDYSRSGKAAEVRMVVVWCERIEDKDSVPWEGLLNISNGPSDMRTPTEYMIVYITGLQSGLFRVHVTCHTDRCGSPLPLVDGMVCIKRSLGVMIRQTAINMAARRRLLSELSLIPHNKRVQKTQEIITRYRASCTESEFYERLFTEST